MAQAAATAPAEESDADVGITPSPPATTDQSTAPAPAPGEQGRQITVRPRAPPKPPPAPIEPHPSAPVSVQPKQVAPPAVGQKPPPAEESDKDVGIVPYPGLATDVGKGAWGGLAEGVEGLFGTPHDIPKLADYGLAWAGAHIDQALGGEDAQQALQRTHGSFLRAAVGDHAYNALTAFAAPGAADYQRWFKQAGIDPGYTPQGVAGRYAHEIAAFAPGALIPFGEAGLAARLGSTIAPAIGSETLGDMAKGTSWEPWARMAGAGLGSIGQMAGVAGVKGFTAPMTEAGQQDIAASRFQAGTRDPAAASQAIRDAQAQRQPGMATGENIAGSKPTTGQVTGDLGQLDLERQLQAVDPATHAARMTAQRAAQSEALGQVVTGSPDTVADMITNRLRQIDQQHEAQVEMARQMHETGRQIHETGVQQAEDAARAAAGKVARRGEPEVLGERARGALAESMAAARKKEGALWDAIGADKIGVRPHQIGGQARRIQRQMGDMQKPMEGDEKRIFDKAAMLTKEVRKLSDVTDLTSDLKTAMRKERLTNGSTPALARMTELLKTSENVIKNSATRQSAKEAEEEMGRLRAMTPQDRANILAARAATRARGEIERGPAGQIIRQGAMSGSYRTMESQVPGKIFAKGPTGYQKLKAYIEALNKPANEPTSPTLTPQGVLRSPAIPGVQAGKPTLPPRANSNFSPVTNMDPVHDIVSDSLAREATTDGMIDPAELARWQENHKDALRALPADIRQKFLGGEADAAAALAEGAAARREALIAHNKLDVAKEVGKSPAGAMRADPAYKGLEGITDPRDVQKAIGGMFERKDAVATMSRLAQAVSGNPTAADGLKRAVLDHIIDKVTSTAEAGTTGVQALKPGMTQSYLTKNRAVLKAAGFSGEQLANFDKIVADIQRQQRFGATRYPGQSNTAQDIFKHMKEASEAPHNFGVWGKLFAAKEGLEIVDKAAEHVHDWTYIPKGPLKALGAAAVPVINKLMKARQAGLAKATDLVHDAVMDPDKAADLLSRPTPGSQRRLDLKYARHAMYAGLAGERPMVLKRAQ